MLIPNQMFKSLLQSYDVVLDTHSISARKLIDKVHTRKVVEKSSEAGLKKLKDIMEEWSFFFWLD